MYCDAVKSAFGLFPIDPPGKLGPGDYVRVGRNGQVRHYGDLASLLGAKVEINQVSHDLEYFSNGVTKGGLSSAVDGVAEAKVSFSDQPGLYIRGKRKVLRIRNLQPLLLKLAKATVDWSIRFRIVVEAQVVEHADIVCSTHSSGAVKARYDQEGIPIGLDANYEQSHSGVLHLPDISGTIAFGAIRYIRGLGAFGSNPLPPFEYRHLDVDDPDDVEDSLDED